MEHIADHSCSLIQLGLALFAYGLSYQNTASLTVEIVLGHSSTSDSEMAILWHLDL